jgi:hypothetical protein
MIQYTAPSTAIPMKPSLPDHTPVAIAPTTYINTISPNPNESKLFQRTVKNLSFVIATLLSACRFPAPLCAD